MSNMFSSLSDKLTYLTSAFLVGTASFKALCHAGSTAKCNAVHVINDLRINMLCGAKYIKTRAFGCSRNLGTNSLVSFEPCLVAVICFNHCSSLLLLLFTLTGFTFLADDTFAFIADTLALVRLRSTL